MRLIDADALTDFLKCLLPERGMWEIDGDVGENAVCETIAEAIEMVKNMETIKPETNCSEMPNNSDCISRQAVYDALDNIKIPRNASWYPYYQQALTAVSKLPSAQPDETKVLVEILDGCPLTHLV